jgi:hypothetical protein
VGVVEVRWGILGTGTIARQFATGLEDLPEAECLAVGFRSKASADRFADALDIPRRYASYEDLAGDPDVDVVYVATPNVFHEENVALCLKSGKAVLCEKPLTVNAREAERLVGLAREMGLFLMEGMWTRFFPLMGLMRALISGGAIGEARLLAADFGYRVGVDPAHRRFAPALGGGARVHRRATSRRWRRPWPSPGSWTRAADAVGPELPERAKERPLEYAILAGAGCRKTDLTPRAGDAHDQLRRAGAERGIPHPG